jgi:hypothetical protein
METIVDHLKSSDDDLPIVHQFGKLMVGLTAGLLAKNLAQKAYIAGLECYRIRKAAVTQ